MLCFDLLTGDMKTQMRMLRFGRGLTFKLLLIHSSKNTVNLFNSFLSSHIIYLFDLHFRFPR